VATHVLQFLTISRSLKAINPSSLA
jgi:hypothetical protein